MKTNAETIQTANLVEASTQWFNFWRATFISPPLQVMAEFLNFVGRRLQADADLFATLSRCERTVETLRAQSSFAQAALSDYRAEAEALARQADSAEPARAA
jgi:hypothetical protein